MRDGRIMKYTDIFYNKTLENEPVSLIKYQRSSSPIN